MSNIPQCPSSLMTSKTNTTLQNKNNYYIYLDYDPTLYCIKNEDDLKNYLIKIINDLPIKNVIDDEVCKIFMKLSLSDLIILARKKKLRFIIKGNELSDNKSVVFELD